LKARAAERGTAQQAQAMVAKAIALFREQGESSFAVMNRGAATGFLEGDLYVFVLETGPGGRTVVQALDNKLVGDVVAGLTDSRGMRFGQEMLARATPEGAWVDYVRLNPQTGKEEPKSSWVVRFGGYIFGCGIYKAD
jgi:cytochrome c